MDIVMVSGNSNLRISGNVFVFKDDLSSESSLEGGIGNFMCQHTPETLRHAARPLEVRLDDRDKYREPSDKIEQAVNRGIEQAQREEHKAKFQDVIKEERLNRSKSLEK